VSRRRPARGIVTAIAVSALTVAGVLGGATPAAALTTGTLVPPKYLTLQMLTGTNTIQIPYTSDAVVGKELYLLIRDAGPANTTYSKVVMTQSGGPGAGYFTVALDLPSDVAEGDTLLFAVSDTSDIMSGLYATASRTIVAPGALSIADPYLFSGSWGSGIEIAGTGFPSSGDVAVSVMSGSDAEAATAIAGPTTVTTDALGALALDIPATTLMAKGAPRLPGSDHRYYRVRAVDEFGNVSETALQVRAAAPGTSVTPATVDRGSGVAVTAPGFLPHETVEFWLGSTRLTSTSADASGEASAAIAIPGTTTKGTHQLEVRGASSGSQWLAIEVTVPSPSPSPTPSPSVTPSPSPNPTVTPSPVPSPSSAPVAPSPGPDSSGEDGSPGAGESSRSAPGSSAGSSADSATEPEPDVLAGDDEDPAAEASGSRHDGQQAEGGGDPGQEGPPIDADGAELASDVEDESPGLLPVVVGVTLVLLGPAAVLGWHAVRRQKSAA